MTSSTTNAVGLAIAIAIALIVLTRSGKFEAATYRRANWAGWLAWVVLLGLALWVGQRIILPTLFD